ncbi:energy transducer TonB [Flavobacterium orientale]|uniref:TonB protein C-terminal n=1 Tax=Flavobacterium orientale TaxID=1756020 RepID=A0A916Y7R0_9FLAO|nr:hypothetical protein [Flavobacterium orientale]GGD34326.1 hypothetical protein GCM10011343_25270 [Flavobacterium orientale]
MRKFIIPILICTQFIGCTIIKTNNKIVDDKCLIDVSENHNKLIYYKTDTPPKFKGHSDFTKYLIQEILIKRNFNNEEVKLKFSFEFIIEKDGLVSSANFLGSDSNELNSLDKDALEIIKNSVWEPARCNEKIVVFKKKINIYVSLD